MKYLSFASVLLLLVVFVTGCNESAPTAAQLGSSIENPTEAYARGVVHHASLGGADVCEALGLPTGCDANFSLVANELGDSTITGQWHDMFGGGVGIHVAIDCLHVVGDSAIVGGLITHAFGDAGGVVGDRALTAVVDNGTSANDPADQLSFSFFPTGGLNCTTLNAGDFPLFDLSHGQVRVN